MSMDMFLTQTFEMPLLSRSLSMFWLNLFRPPDDGYSATPKPTIDLYAKSTAANFSNFSCDVVLGSSSSRDLDALV